MVLTWHTRAMPLDARRALDPILEGLARLSQHLTVRDPVRWRLAEHRRRVVGALSSELRPEVVRLTDGVLRHQPDAVAAYDTLVADAIERMRASRPEGHALLGALDRALYANREELLDDPSFSEAERLYVLDRLDRLNDILGSYESFVALTLPLIEQAEARGRHPVTLHDLAAGHGGFALVLKERLGERVAVVGSDVKEEYLALGRKEARRRGLDVSFVAQDALALGNLGDEHIDVMSCTQSLHHFPPGMIARMVGEAARVAKAGLVFIDIERSWLSIALAAPFALAYGRTYAVVHDTVVSLRRAYYEEELALLAALAPGMPQNARIETGFAKPAHSYLRLTLE